MLRCHAIFVMSDKILVAKQLRMSPFFAKEQRLREQVLVAGSENQRNGKSLVTSPHHMLYNQYPKKGTVVQKWHENT